MRGTRLLGPAAWVLCAVGCVSRGPDAGDGVRLTNGTIDVVFSPSTARIVRYGLADGTNLLWTLDDPISYAEATGKWNNWGGDKTWIWPQDDWKVVLGKGWPPPAACEQVERLERPTPLTIRTGSPIVAGYGVRLLRDIRLAPEGTELSVTARLVPEGGVQSEPPPFAAWTVMQIPARADAYYARPVGQDFRWTRFDDRRGFSDPVAIAGTRVLRLPREPGVGGKVGLDGDAVGVRYGSVLLVVEVGPFAEGGRFDPGARLQLYTTPDASPQFPASAGPYTELEFTAPLVARDRVAAYPVITRWRLHRLAAGADDAEIAALLTKGR